MITVGLIGTGYAAKLRAQAVHADPRSQLVAIAGRDAARTQALSQDYPGAIATTDWQAVVTRPDLDVVIIATVNRDHGAIARTALAAGKHVVVEYPLCLDLTEAQSLVAQAQQQQRLLHVEHIELLGGVHQALIATLPQIGQVFTAHYATIKPERPAPQRWSYHAPSFGFPLVGALSRVHRLVDRFGAVDSVSCVAQFWQGREAIASPQAVDFYTTCLCTAQLRFANGVLGTVTYGKGEALWQSIRRCEVQGAAGAIVFEGDTGNLIQPTGTQAIAVGGRRGLFTRDTAAVLDFLTEGTPLYITPEASVYTLAVATAAAQSAAQGGTAIAIPLAYPQLASPS